MKQLLITLTAVVLVGCGESQQTAPAPEPQTDKAPDIPLVLAAQNGNIESVNLHIQTGTDLNQSYNGKNALYEAILAGHNTIVELLIEAGANVNLKHEIYGDTPLYPAAIKGRKKICELLITKGADVNAKRNNGRNPLHIAAYWGHLETVKLLISKGANINEEDNWDETPLDLANDVDLLTEDVKDAKKDISKLLVKHDAKTKKELNVIFDAILTSDIDAVKYHLAAGADVNRRKGYDGRTPLHDAVSSFNDEIVEILIETGADLNAKTEDGETPLHSAAFYGHKENVELLLANGANVNAKANSGETPLDTVISAKKSREEIAELLIDIEANIHAENDDGETPIDNSTDEIADLLRKHGAKTSEELKAEGK